VSSQNWEDIKYTDEKLADDSNTSKGTVWKARKMLEAAKIDPDPNWDQGVDK
jgi:hypothetical protein